MSCGKRGLSSSNFCLTPLTTVLALAPRSPSTRPHTASRSALVVTTPLRGSAPKRTSATSATRMVGAATGGDHDIAQVVERRMRPSERTSSASSPSRTRPAPSLRLLEVTAFSSCCGRDAARRHRRRRTAATSNVRTKPPSTLTSATPGRPRSAGRMVQSTRLRISCAFSVSELDGEHQHFAERRHDRREAAVGAGRQLVAHLLQPLVDLRAGPENVGAVGELERHQRDRVARRRAHRDQVGDAAHGDLDRRGHAAFELLRREAGARIDDQHLHRRDVRKGVDRQLEERHWRPRPRAPSAPRKTRSRCLSATSMMRPSMLTPGRRQRARRAAR